MSFLLLESEEGKIKKKIKRLRGEKKIKTQLIKKNQIVKIEERGDNFCCIRAILTAISYLNKVLPTKSLKKRNEIEKRNENELKKIVKSLNFNDSAIGINEIKRIEAYLEIFSISVINGDKGFVEKYLYKGVKNEKFIYIILTNNHYDTIPSIKRYFNHSYFCDSCKRGTKNVGKHYCKETCFCCYNQNCLKISKEKRKCQKCKVYSRNFKCMQRHNFVVCNKKEFCKKCDFIKFKKHVCLNQKYCSNCKLNVDFDHRCFINKDKNFKFENKFESYIFYDYECMQINNINIPNLVVARKVCAGCLDKENFCKDKCQLKIFERNEDFCQWLFEQDNSIGIAHNFKVRKQKIK